jgi:hypothetical protein
LERKFDPPPLRSYGGQALFRLPQKRQALLIVICEPAAVYSNRLRLVVNSLQNEEGENPGADMRLAVA